MKPPYVTSEALDQFIKQAFLEDVGEGDHSTLASVPEDATDSAKIVLKEDGVIAGLELAELIFKKLDPDSKIDFKKKDGEKGRSGDIILTISGNARSILTAERIVLNCLQRMSGIAAKSARASEILKNTQTRILDTRKTTPCFRMCEKWAVHIGGGKNHRYGLFDMIMLKDNHIAFSGGIQKAIENTLGYLKDIDRKIKIEIETSSIEEVKEVINVGGVDIIMLDNMDVETMTKCVDLINNKYVTEASGGISEEDLLKVASSGVDYISMGALTHSAGIIDISLKALV
ncbi:MAG: carboxylating nicotinate-nucleotide diphosphorylase [Bacteroidota bacterium]